MRYKHEVFVVAPKLTRGLTYLLWNGLVGMSCIRTINAVISLYQRGAGTNKRSNSIHILARRGVLDNSNAVMFVREDESGKLLVALLYSAVAT